MAELLPTDLHLILSRLPKDLHPFFVENQRQLFLAGGFVRAVIAGERPNDIDLFGSSEQLVSGIAKDIALKRKGRMFKTKNAFTILAPPRVPVQLIHRWTFVGPVDLVESFDFTIAQVAIWWEGDQWHSFCSDRFYADLAARRLYYTAPIRVEEVGGSLLRMKKFLAAGYNIQTFSFGRFLARISSGVRWDAFDKAVSELNAAESAEAYLGRVFTALLREVDPLTVVDGVDLEDGTPVEENAAPAPVAASDSPQPAIADDNAVPH